MMKLAIFLTAFISANALATPKVGDYVKYDAVAQKNGTSIGLTIEQTLVDYNASTNQYLERQTNTITNGQSETSEGWKSADDYLTDETINTALNNCSSVGGTLQTIQVPAGLFNSCAIPFENSEDVGTVWITTVPFGVAKIMTTKKTDGLTIEAKLSTYR